MAGSNQHVVLSRSEAAAAAAAPQAVAISVACPVTPELVVSSQASDFFFAGAVQAPIPAPEKHDFQFYRKPGPMLPLSKTLLPLLMHLWCL